MADSKFNLPNEYSRDTVAKALTDIQPVRTTPTIISAPDLGASEMNRLFDMTNRGPFAGYRPEQISEELQEFYQTPGGLAEDNFTPLYLAGYILGKIHNDRFIHGPPDGSGSILDDETNKLPGWEVVDGTTNGGSVVWADEGNGVGVLKFYIEDGAVDDVLYVQQDIFVSGGNIDILSLAADWIGIADIAGGAEGKYDTFIEYAWYYPDGTINGSATTKYYSNATTERLDRLWLVTNSRQNAFLRVKIGVRVDVAYTTGEQYLAKLNWTWIDDPESYDVTLPWFRESWTPDTGASTYDMRMFTDAVVYGVSVWTASGPGLLLALSVYTNDVITAGSIDFYPRVNSNDKDGILKITLESGETGAAAFRDPSGATGFDFNALQRIDVEATRTAGFASGTGVDYVGTLHAKIAVAYDEDAPGGGGGPFGIAST